MKRAASIIAGILIFCTGVSFLNYIYVSDFDSYYERFLWHNFYKDKGKIDNLYLGSSHVFCDLDPSLLDKLNGQYNFNLATPGQLMNGTYYLLREADRENKLGHVYVELYYCYHVNTFANEEAIKAFGYKNWWNIDYMKFSLNKWNYMMSVTDIEDYVNVWFPFIRYRSKLDDWEHVRWVVNRKQSDDYANYGSYRINYEDGYQELKEKGFRYSTRIYQDNRRIYEQERILGENPISETSERYLRNAIEYCKKREIPITLFVSPIYELQLISTENYDNYIKQAKEIAEEYNIAFYDFNLAKEEYLPIQNTKYFKDEGHLNSAGAGLYTDFFYKVMSGDASENKTYFYDSYAQKLQNAVPTVYGIYYNEMKQTDDAVGKIRNMWIASNRDEEMEYRIILTPDDEEQYMVQDFSENKAFSINSMHGVCTIVYRIKNMPDIVQTAEINY